MFPHFSCLDYIIFDEAGTGNLTVFLERFKGVSPGLLKTPFASADGEKKADGGCSGCR